MRHTDDGVTSFPLTRCRPSLLFLFPKHSAKGRPHMSPYLRAVKEPSDGLHNRSSGGLRGRPRSPMGFRYPHPWGSWYPKFSVLRAFAPPSPLWRHGGTALRWQTPGCRGETQRSGVAVSLAEHGWPPQPHEEASLISTLARAVSGSGAVWVQPRSTPLQAQPLGDTGKHQFQCLSPSSGSGPG